MTSLPIGFCPNNWREGRRAEGGGKEEGKTGMTKDSAENKKFISVVLDTFSIPNFYIRKYRPHGHRYWKSTWMQRILFGESTCKKMPQKEV